METRINLATLLAAKESIRDRKPEMTSAMVPADVFEDILDDLIDFHTEGIKRPKKDKKK